MQMMRELRTRTMQVHDENKYMAMREVAHRQSMFLNLYAGSAEAFDGLLTTSVASFSAVNDSTHSRVLYWAIFECAVVIAMSIGQVVYLKRFFEQKRMV